MQLTVFRQKGEEGQGAAKSVPPSNALALMPRLAYLKRVTFVFEVRDLWPRSIVEVGAMSKTSPIVRGREKLERLLYRGADHMVVVTESFVDEIAGHGIERSKMTVVTNGVDLNLFSPRPRDEARRALELPGGFLATYAGTGTHGMAHGLGTVLDAAKLVGDDGVTLLLVGEGAEKATFKERAAREGIRNVVFWDQQPRDRVAQIIAASDRTGRGAGALPASACLQGRGGGGRQLDSGMAIRSDDPSHARWRV